MTEVSITTNHRAKVLMAILIALVAIFLIIWSAIYIFAPERPKPEQPVTQPCTCKAVTPEAPAELPKTGVDL